eukprot:scaffold1525_cov142-Cylindrotheca_fusiformis.AAC.182
MPAIDNYPLLFSLQRFVSSEDNQKWTQQPSQPKQHKKGIVGTGYQHQGDRACIATARHNNIRNKK